MIATEFDVFPEVSELFNCVHWYDTTIHAKHSLAGMPIANTDL